MAQVAYTSLEKLLLLLRSVPIREGAYVSVLGPSVLGLGTDPLRPTHTIDIAREALSDHTNNEVPMQLVPSSMQKVESAKTSGSPTPNSAPTQNHPRANGARYTETKPQDNGPGSSLIGRLEAATFRRPA